MNVRFRCPSCNFPDTVEIPREHSWQCQKCGHVLLLSKASGQELTACAICGNPELYKKKDFPHWLGLTILAAACAAFLWAQSVYEPWVAWLILIASAVFDGLFYVRVGDAIVCYRCGGQYRGILPSPPHQPFDLATQERYRQEKLRSDRLLSEKKTSRQ